ncbi:hypothetical protein [Plasmodium yoelii yoelii]|nr:hypothetical protein [Plasmodium yoelii yoelii]
MLRERD